MRFPHPPAHWLAAFMGLCVIFLGAAMLLSAVAQYAVGTVEGGFIAGVFGTASLPAMALGAYMMIDGWTNPIWRRAR